MSKEAAIIEQRDAQAYAAQRRMDRVTVSLLGVVGVLDWDAKPEQANNYLSITVGSDFSRSNITTSLEVLKVSIDLRHPEVTHVAVLNEKTEDVRRVGGFLRTGHTRWRDVIQDGENLHDRLTGYGKMAVRKGRRMLRYDVEEENERKIREGILKGLDLMLDLDTNPSLKNKLQEVLEPQKTPVR